MKNQQRKINKTKSWFFGQVNIIDKFVARIIEQKESVHKLLVSMKMAIINDPMNIKRVVK